MGVTPKRIRPHLYPCYTQMVARCEDKGHKWYSSYGGRGIKVDPSWRGKGGFDKFVEDMGKRPEGYSLDRIDNNGNYTPSNCRWASKTVQSINQRPKSSNTSGYTGVIWNKARGVYQARIQLHGKGKHLGSFDNIEEAVKVRKEAEKLYFKPLLEASC